FGAIADRYDLMNRVMTLGMDQRWRRQAADLAVLSPGQSALDVATGTGDLAFELVKHVMPGGDVIGVDFTKEMLDHARSKAAARELPARFELADALHLPFPDSRFHATTCGFGLRNFDNRFKALEEIS